MMEKNNPKVLIAEDERIIADWLAKILSRSGFDSAQRTRESTLRQQRVLVPQASVAISLPPVEDKPVAVDRSPHLTAAKDRKGRFSGYYKCSLCEAVFRPNPDNRSEIMSMLAAHIRLSHPVDKMTSEDVNQAAAGSPK
jgi:predicted small metal-binding protein